MIFMILAVFELIDCLRKIYAIQALNSPWHLFKIISGKINDLKQMKGKMKPGKMKKLKIYIEFSGI